ncbi:hypothetical protein MOX02_59030 [Methylobacterium oxalidis]|uniref:Uncharacterized protein n=1 Tax=Methylobacterium oxalidis TaxID=944322 RepID=A0A512JD62_9HYPH|nr:hypothetical protein MOX02_59030 [Methylobacterium oxalidis]GLS64457.1 hypothetical protein GCM10007888_28380 [Methylobacterium oxalidis]
MKVRQIDIEQDEINVGLTIEDRESGYTRPGGCYVKAAAREIACDVFREIDLVFDQQDALAHPKDSAAD